MTNPHATDFVHRNESEGGEVPDISIRILGGLTDCRYSPQPHLPLELKHTAPSLPREFQVIAPDKIQSVWLVSEGHKQGEGQGINKQLLIQTLSTTPRTRSNSPFSQQKFPDP